MAKQDAGAGADLENRTQAWLEALEQAISGRRRADFDGLFLEDSYWRDMVSLTWDTCQFWGRDALRDAVFEAAAKTGFTDLQLDPDRSAPRVADFIGEPYVEVFFAFRNAVGRGKGFARLQEDANAVAGLRAHMVATTLHELDCAPEPRERHPRLGFEPAFPGQSYAEWNAAKRDFSERDPDVLIIGGSHSGLCVGARFERKGVSYLIVEKNANPGDMWRGRYEALALHTPTTINHLPYVPLPDHWSLFTPKDQWADWLDCYAKLMNLNFQGNAEALECRFDERTRTWEVPLRLADGTIRRMRPTHVVLAVGGVGGRPRIPELPGLDAFRGEVMHSTAFESGAPFAGKRVMVVGSSTTGHDISLDLALRGADTTMAQRGPSCVVNISEVIAFGADYARVSTEEADFLRSAMPYPLWIKRAKVYTQMTERTHATLHEGLRKAGQKLTIGDDETGWSIKLFREAAGYYLNVGASEAIVDGLIKIQDYDRIERFVPEGALLDDGKLVELDAVVLCTGFWDLANDIEALLGPEVAQRVGRCNGVDPKDGEYRTMSRPTAQPHLWLINGGIPDSRKSSDLLAMQVIAQLEGLVPSLVRGPDGRVKPL
ncbi:MAG: NAD(P)/FAD-dependent oxidoreductase [Myxococcota bacterium]